MRRTVILLLFLCLLPVSAAALTRTVGAGKDYTSLATCFAALVNGDTVETYGPYTELNQSLTTPVGVTGITWRHYGADYTLDGTGATATCMAWGAGANTWDVDVQSTTGRLTVTGYIGATPFTVGGTGNTFAGLRMTANGAVGVGQSTLVITGTGNTIRQVLVDSPVDPTNQNWYGIRCEGSTSTVIELSIVEGASITGAGKDAFLIYANSTTVAPTVRGCIARNSYAEDRVYGIYFTGPWAAMPGEYGTISDSTVHGLTADGRTIGFGAYGRSVHFSNLSAYDFVSVGAVDRGVELGGTLVDPAAPDSTIENCTMVGGSRGFYIGDVPVAGGRTVQNCISDGGTTDEFSCGVGAVAVSLNNCAANGDYSGNWPVDASDLSVDPLFVDASGDDYHLRGDSPCVDTGLWATGRDHDLDYNPISGREMDRGCFEFQWQNPRSVRSVGSSN